MTGTRTRNASGSVTEDPTEKLIQKVCSTFVNQLRAEFDARFKLIEEKLNGLSSSLAAINGSMNDFSQRIEALEMNLDVIEQDRKSNALRIIGLQEQDDEDTVKLVSSFIQSSLKVNCSIQDLDCVHRVGRDTINGKPRPVTVTFVQKWKPNQVYNNKKALKKSSYAIFEDLTKKRYESLIYAKKKFGKNNVWSSNGNIFRWDARENKKIKLSC